MINTFPLCDARNFFSLRVKEEQKFFSSKFLEAHVNTKLKLPRRREGRRYKKTRKGTNERIK